MCISRLNHLRETVLDDSISTLSNPARVGTPLVWKRQQTAQLYFSGSSNTQGSNRVWQEVHEETSSVSYPSHEADILDSRDKFSRTPSSVTSNHNSPCRPLTRKASQRSYDSHSNNGSTRSITAATSWRSPNVVQLRVLYAHELHVRLPSRARAL